jgi:hypothetical protein
MAVQKLVDQSLIEGRGRNIGDIASPPLWFARPVVKSDAAELARIAEDKRMFPLIQSQVVVFGRSKIRKFHSNPARHSEVDPEPVVIGKLKQHALAMRFRPQQLFSAEMLAQRGCVCFPENPVPRVQVDMHHLVAEAGVPLFAIPFDLGELWHGGGT